MPNWLLPRLLQMTSLVVCLAGGTATAGTLTSVSPQGASPGVTVHVVGSGFNANAASNQVTLAPAAAPASAISLTASTIAVVDVARGLYRLGFTVPAGLPAGAAAIRVTNTGSGEVSEGRSLDVVGFTVTQGTSARPSETVSLRLQGTPNTQWLAGRTRLALGAGITVGTVVVDSLTTLSATLTVAADATAGPRTVSVIASTQTAMQSGAFTVMGSAPPANTAPVANAGSDQAITLPAGATLSGSATDDGLPAPPGLTYAWSIVSAPGTVTFSAPTAATTSAAFSMAGTYLLRLMVNDGALSGADDVAITVNAAPPANTAPVANAGSDQAITLPAGATLSGSATDDGLPAPPGLTYAWSIVSAPGTVTFSAPTAATTSAAFSVAGTYVLRLTVNDGALSGADDVAITVNAAPPANTAPVANAGGPYSGTTTAAVLMSGVRSTDSDGDTLAFAWDFGDGSAGSGPTPQHLYGAPGTYTVTLLVSDGRTGLDTATTRAVIAAPPATSNAAPTAAANGPYTGRVGQAVSFSASGSSDPDSHPLSFAWTFGDGESALGLSVSHAFSASGTYTVTLLVTDGRGGSDTATALVVIEPLTSPPANAAPAAVAVAPPAAAAGALVAFSSTGTNDPDGDTLSFAWTFGDGDTATTASASHAFAAPGTYVVTLLVSDGRGGLGSATTTITISTEPGNGTPTASAGGPYNGAAGDAITFAATAADPDGDPLRLAWDFGDGTTGSGANPSKTYALAGTYRVTLTVTDGRGGIGTSTTTVTVSAPTGSANQPPLARAGGPYASPVNANLIFTGGSSSDPNPGDTLTFAWNFGDGTTGNGPTPSHVYARTGSYTVTLLVTDSQGATSADTAIVTVTGPAVPANQNPAAVLAAVAPAIAGRAVTFDASSSTDPDGDPLTFAWDFGDNAVGSGATVPHGFSAAGRFVVTVLVTDGRGGSATASVTVDVAAAPVNATPTVTAGDDQAITLPAGATLTGTVNDDGQLPGQLTTRWSQVAGPSGASAVFATPSQASTAVTFPVAGGYTLRLTVNDGEFTVADDVVVVVNPAPTPNVAPTVGAGDDQAITLPAGATLTGAVNDDGQLPGQLALAWSQVNGPGGASAVFATLSQASTAVTFPAAGDYTLRLTANDGQFTVADDVVVTVNAAPTTDALPPNVTLSGPQEALPGARATFVAQATDNVGVVAVRFEVDGVAGPDLTQPPFERVIDVPQVVTPGRQYVVRAVARDEAGNLGEASATLTVVASTDTDAPTVSLNAPGTSAPGAVIVLTAQASDGQGTGVARVVFLVDGVEVASDADAPFETEYLVPSGAQVGSTLTVAARAVDFAGNAAESARGVQVVSTADTTPPSVALSAPAETIAGATITLTATATDANGIASVAFLVGGAVVATDTQAPYEATYVVADAMPAGTALQVAARATDLAGLEATDQRTVTIVAPTALAAGVITGEVYDDATGLPVAGATVRLTGTDAVGALYDVETTTDSRGRYILRANPGQGVVVITRDGWTQIDRRVAVRAGEALELLDARLTPFAGAAQRVSAVIGGTVGLAGSQIVIPPGALAQTTAMRAVQVGAQGIQGVLPAGWAPVAGINVAPHGAEIPGGATLRVSNGFGLGATVALVLARWDEAEAAWRTVADVTGSAGPLEATVHAAGQYVWLLADAMPRVPPAAVAGALLDGVATPTLSADAAGATVPEPRVLFYRPGVTSNVGNVITLAAPVTSGVLMWAQVVESYRFYSGAEIHPEPSTQDLVFYQAPGTPATLSARHVVSPSQTFEAITLERGVITVALQEPGAAPAPVAVVGAGGGAVPGPSGESLVLPPGATTGPAPVQLRNLDETGLGAAVPAGLQFLRGVQVISAVAFAAPGALSAPAPAGLVDASDVLLVRLQEIGGRTRFVLAGRARLDAGRLVADFSIGGQPAPFDGVRGAGRFAFLRSAASLGFASGLVSGLAGQPFSGALVSSSTLPIVSFSRQDGAYALAAIAGPNTVTATDLVRTDVGSASAALPAGAVVGVNLRLTPQPPTVTAITPANSARNVPLSDPIVVVFSEPIDPASVAGQNSANVVLAPAGGERVDGVLSLSANNTRLSFRPAAPLAPNTVFTFTLTTGIVDLSGNPLAAPFVATFESLDTSPPPTPPAGSITAAIPQGGQTTVTATQGTAGPRDTVTVRNVTRGTSTPALVDPNGGFMVRMAAAIADRLQIVIRDQSGNETVVDVPRFRTVNPDGSVSSAVTSEGGTVEGPGGIATTIQPGTFPQGAVVTLQTVSEADFPVQLSAQDRQHFSYTGGVSIDFGGAEPQQYVDLSIPAVGNEPRDRQWVVARAVNVAGRLALEPVDSARRSGSRIITSSPPCPGVMAAGVYGFINASTDLGYYYTDMANPEFGGVVVSPELMQAGTAMQLPFLVFSLDVPRRFCMPVLSGRVSVVPNSVKVRVPGSELAPADRLVVVHNSTTGVDGYATRDVAEFVFTMAGNDTQTYQVVATGPGGQVPVTIGALVAAVPGEVRITLDPDQILVPITQVEIRNVSAGTSQVFPVATPDVDVAVDGAASDGYAALARNASHAERPVSSSVLPPTVAGNGNMLLRVRRGTIDPTRAELDAINANVPAREHVYVDVDPDGSHGPVPATRIEVPAAAIVQGGAEWAFNAPVGAQFQLIVRYDLAYGYQPDQLLTVPVFRLTATNPVTGRVLKSITVSAPPRDQPMSIPPLTDDTTAPFLISGPPRLDNFDPTGQFSFTFSESMNVTSLRQAFQVEVKIGATYKKLTNGEIRISNRNRTVTFVPASGLRLGAEYRITLAGNDSLGSSLVPGAGLGIRDGAGNALPTTVFTVKTAAPRIAGRLFNDATDLDGHPPLFVPGGAPLPTYAPFKDVSLLRHTVAGVSRSTLFVTAGEYTQHDKFFTVDVTEPTTPTKLRSAASDAGPRRQRATFLGDVTMPTWLDLACVGDPSTFLTGLPPENRTRSACPPGTFHGDIVVTTTFNPTYSFLSIYNVTDVEHPRWMANKLLTVAPTFMDTLNLDNQRGLVKIPGYAKGVALVDDGVTVRAFAAVEGVGVMAADLSQSLPNRNPAERFTEPVFNGDFSDIVKFRDYLLALEKTEGRLYVMDAALSVRATLQLPEEPCTLSLGMCPPWLRRIETVEQFGTDANFDGLIEPSETFDLAIIGTSRKVFIVNVSTPTSPALLGTISMPGIVRDLSIDPVKRRLFVVGEKTTGVGDQQLMLVDLTDLGQGFAADVDMDELDDRIIWVSSTQANGVEADPERGLAYVTTNKGLEVWALETCCDLGTDTAQTLEDRPQGERQSLLARERAALQQGIAAGLHAAQAACTGFVGTGVSMLEQGSGACLWKVDPAAACSDNYQPGVSDHDFEVFFPNGMLIGGPSGSTASCVIDQLTAQFIDPVTDRPKPIVLPGGGRVSFEDITFFPVAREEFEAARLNILPPASGGSDESGDMGLGRQQLLLKWLLEGEYVSVPGFVLQGASLDVILDRLKTQTLIPVVEGYEWSVLQEAQLAKAKAYIRIKGSSSPTSTMHGFFIKQMHDAGKAGIRAALARMVATPEGNATVLEITRAKYADDGCVVPTLLLSDPNDWTAKACTSFEEYVASAAARTLQRVTPLPIFTEHEVRNLVHRFFRVKADLETPGDDAAADSFIATVAAFIHQNKVLTQPVYDGALPTDPQAAQRTANLDAAAAKLVALLSEAKVHVKPHVFNRGFRNAKGVAFKYFVRPAGGSVTERRSITIDLGGGDDRVLDFERNADGTLALDADGKARPLFVLGPIDQRTGAGQPGHVAFTVDLPGRVMKEADRQNNFDGYFYYTLPVTGTLPGSPSTAAKVPLPFPDPGLLEPDAVCGDVPPLRITQRILRGTEVLSGMATAGLGEQLTIRLTVENLSSLPQPEATACSSLANVCVSTGPLAPGAIWTHDIPYTVPAIGAIVDAVATLTSPTQGVVTSTPTRLAASCEVYRVLPLDPNPNPDEGTIGRGGSALRYFRVVNPRTGAPLADATVNLELRGTDPSGAVGLFPLTAQTNARGLLVSPGQERLVIPFTGGPAAYPHGSSFELKVGAVNGVAPVCDTTEIARLTLNDLEYSESFARGTGIEGSIGFIASVEGGLEGGLEMERTDKVTQTGVQPKELEVERALKLSGKVGVGFDLFKFSGSAAVVKASVSAETGVETERSTEWKTKWGFTYPFDATANCNLADITLTGLWGVHPIFTKLIDLARSHPCVNLDRNLKSSATTFGRQATASAQVGLKVETPFGKLPELGEPSKDGLALSFGGSGSSGFSLETSYEMSYAPGAAGNQPTLTGNKEEYKVKGGFDWLASLGIARAEIDADPAIPPGEKPQKKEEAEVEFEGLKAALDFSASGTTAETYGLAFEWDFTRPSTWPDPSSISVTYAGPKVSGVKKNVGGPTLDLVGPANGQRVYKFEERDDISFLVQNLANLGEIRNSNVGSGVLRQLVFEPTVLTQELGRFFATRYRTRPTYADVEARAVGADFPIGVTAKLAGFSLGIGASLKAEAKIKYTTERGVFLGGTQYPLEKYSPSLFPAPSLTMQMWRAVETSWDALIASFASQFSDKQATAGGGGGTTTTLRSDFTATLTIDNAFEPVPFEAGLFSYRYDPRPADPAIDVQLLPSDTFGPEGAPHYGVGGFHQFWPANRTLAVPTRLVIDYQDAEVAGFDESTLAIYRWNQERQDWDFVGGTLNQTANTVTTFIRRLGLYTLGIQMPAGGIPFIFMNGGQTGVDEDRVQRFQVLTDTLTLNTGGPVPDGTVYAVRSLYPASGSTTAYGRIIATDVDPVREGVQVASQNGVIAFDVEFPAPFGNYRPGRVLVYATRGTAAGDVVLVQ